MWKRNYEWQFQIFLLLLHLMIDIILHWIVYRFFNWHRCCINFKQCSVCNECWLEMKLRADNVCHRCFVDKNKSKMFSFENKMGPGLFPVELKNLSTVE